MIGPRPLHRSTEIAASLESLRPLGEWLHEVAGEAGLATETIAGFDHALNEAVENVVRYAWSGAAGHPIRVTFRCNGALAEVEIEDDGQAFDPRSVPPLVAPASLENLVPGGYGVAMIRHFTDEILYRRDEGWNRLTLRRWLAAEGALFRGVPAPVVATVLANGRHLSLSDNEVLLEPGSRNDRLFVLLHGCLQIRLGGGATAGTIEVAPGECVGEFSIIDGQPTSAQVVASGPSEVVSLPEDLVWAEPIPAPNFARNLLQILTTRLRRAAQSQAAYEKLRQELQVAREIQSSMLPHGDRMFPDHPEVGCAAAIDPAAEVGGDFYDAFFLDERHLFFAVGDVSGKGIGAALFMARCLTLLRREATERRSLPALASRLNAALAEGNEGGHFLALFAGILDTKTGELRFVNGGLGAPLIRRGTRWERPPMPRGLVLGIYPEFTYGPGQLSLAVGDALAVFTDGVTDAAPLNHEAFGEARLIAALTAGKDHSAPGLVAAAQEAVRSYVGGAPPFDDFTLLVVERRSATPAGSPEAPTLSTAARA